GGGGRGRGGGDLALAPRAGGLVPGVEVDGAEDGLGGGGEDPLLGPPAALLLALAEAEPAAEVERARLPRQHLGVHERGAHLREVALARVREARHEKVGDREREDGVAEELERLVVP